MGAVTDAGSMGLRPMAWAHGGTGPGEIRVEGEARRHSNAGRPRLGGPASAVGRACDHGFGQRSLWVLKVQGRIDRRGIDLRHKNPM